MIHHSRVSDKIVDEFKKVCIKEGISYDTEEEYREAAQNMYDFAGLALDMAIEENKRKKRLEVEPKGFSMPGEGRNCSLCGKSVSESDGWYDKWGFKCMNCQDAVNKKKIPGSLCGDWEQKKYVTDSTLSWKSGLHIRTIRKMIDRGKIKARKIPHGPFLILRKDNPNLKTIIEREENLKKRSS